MERWALEMGRFVTSWQSVRVRLHSDTVWLELKEQSIRTEIEDARIMSKEKKEEKKNGKVEGDTLYYPP